LFKSFQNPNESNKKKLGQLSMPNEESLLPALLSYTAEIAKTVGFSSRDCYKIQLAVEEACVHVMKTSFHPGEMADYQVEYTGRLD
jgi:anti-sigma regulatory factor (Ser/Thr protein kinase)